MDVIERRICSLKRTSGSLNIPLTFLSNYLNGKTRHRKIKPIGVLIKEDM
jgi:hypothetical protein